MQNWSWSAIELTLGTEALIAGLAPVVDCLHPHLFLFACQGTERRYNFPLCSLVAPFVSDGPLSSAFRIPLQQGRLSFRSKSSTPPVCPPAALLHPWQWQLAVGHPAGQSTQSRSADAGIQGGLPVGVSLGLSIWSPCNRGLSEGNEMMAAGKLVLQAKVVSTFGVGSCFDQSEASVQPLEGRQEA
jgi:hypothetical protein